MTAGHARRQRARVAALVVVIAAGAVYGHGPTDVRHVIALCVWSSALYVLGRIDGRDR